MTTTQEEQWTKDTYGKPVKPIPQPPAEDLDTYGPKAPKAKDGPASTFNEEIKEPAPKFSKKEKNAAKRKEPEKKKSWGSECESEEENYN